MEGKKGTMKDKKRNGKAEARPWPVIADDRFARLHTDPRFQRLPKAQSRVKIDNRFEKMFHDENFSISSNMDKRGRKNIKSEKKRSENLKKYYHLENEEDDEEEDRQITQIKTNKTDSNVENFKNAEQKKGTNANEKRINSFADNEQSLSDMMGEEEEKKHKRIPKPYDNDMDSKSLPKLKLDKGQIDEEYQEDTDEEEDERDEEEEESSTDISSSDDESELDMEEEEEEKIETTNQISKRLALVNMDWENIRALDILAMLQSFLPKDGKIFSVKVYPSDFGIEQMKNEEVNGPQFIFADNDKENGENTASKSKKKKKYGNDSEDEGNDVDEDKLRAYEKSKLRYYFAVVECDSEQSANTLYESCDGIEFERSSNIIDMRFINDDMVFDDRPVRDESFEIPKDYEAPDFTTPALQLSSVKLTWDDDEPIRVKALRRKFDENQIEELNLDHFLASSSDEGEIAESERENDEAKEEDNDNKAKDLDSAAFNEDRNIKPQKEDKNSMREKYRALLLSGKKNSSKFGRKNKKVDESDGSDGSDEAEHGSAEKNDRKKEEEEEEEEEEMEMEVTFNTGLSELGEKLLQKKKQKEMEEIETVFEKYLRMKKEKKKKDKKENTSRRDDGTDEDDDEDSYERRDDDFFKHDDDDDAFNDPFFNTNEDDMHLENPRAKEGRKGGKGEKKSLNLIGAVSEEERKKRSEEKERERKEEEKRKAELELLLMDDRNDQSNTIKGFNLKKKEKVKKKKKGNKKNRQEAEIEEQDKNQDLTVDFNDARFSSLFDSHHFAIDPTDPLFKRSAGQLSVLAEKQRRRLQEVRNSEQQNSASGAVGGRHSEAGEPEHNKKNKSELNSLLRSLKRKFAPKSEPNGEVMKKRIKKQH